MKKADFTAAKLPSPIEDGIEAGRAHFVRARRKVTPLEMRDERIDYGRELPNADFEAAFHKAQHEIAKELGSQHGRAHFIKHGRMATIDELNAHGYEDLMYALHFRAEEKVVKLEVEAVSSLVDLLYKLRGEKRPPSVIIEKGW